MSKIYVSSTYLDLQEHRAQVERVIRRMGHEDVAMEYYVAEDQRPAIVKTTPKTIQRPGCVNGQRNCWRSFQSGSKKWLDNEILFSYFKKKL